VYFGEQPDTQQIGFPYFDASGNPQISLTQHYSHRGGEFQNFNTAFGSYGQKDGWNHLVISYLNCLWQNMLGPKAPNRNIPPVAASGAGLITL